MSQPRIDAVSAEDRLLRYLSIEGITGQEEKIGAAIAEDLRALGVPSAAITFDTAHERINLPTQTGNLIVQLPGTRSGPRFLFSTHLDTVPLCAGAKPRREGERIVSDGTTALGGDNRTGCAVLVTLLETLLGQNVPHPPLTFLFTVREESGLHGARTVRADELGNPVMGFNFDGKMATDLVIGAVGQESWEVEIEGRESHAGVAPEKGISATMVASVALARARSDGWFGKVEKIGQDGSVRVGTSNIGVLAGASGGTVGDATNVVTGYLRARGESRSAEADFASEITEAFRQAFLAAAEEVHNVEGHRATVRFASQVAYPPFHISADSPVVTHARRAAETLGWTTETVRSNGGLDANWLVKHGIPMVTLGAGQHEIHTKNEFIDVAEFLRSCQLALALATFPTE